MATGPTPPERSRQQDTECMRHWKPLNSGPRSQNNQCVVMNDERKLYKNERSLKEDCTLPRSGRGKRLKEVKRPKRTARWMLKVDRKRTERKGTKRGGAWPFEVVVVVVCEGVCYRGDRG